jgi:carbon-monoxide dehydrogenase medium subunit
MITEIRFPLAPERFAFLECTRKHNDFAVINVAVVGHRDGGGRWSGVRIALGGVSDRVVLAVEAAAALERTALEDEAVLEAGHMALTACDPPDDVRASAEYRRHLIPIYVRRALQRLRDDEGDAYA